MHCSFYSNSLFSDLYGERFMYSKPNNETVKSTKNVFKMVKAVRGCLFNIRGMSLD